MTILTIFNPKKNHINLLNHDDDDDEAVKKNSLTKIYMEHDLHKYSQKIQN